jgi:hypothetical protein
MSEAPAAFFRWDGEDLILNIKVQPRASRDGFAEVLGEQLKIRLTAPPVDGKANAQLVSFLAKSFRVPKSDIELLAGETGRDKRLRIHAPRHLPPIIPAPDGGLVASTGPRH